MVTDEVFPHSSFSLNSENTLFVGKFIAEEITGHATKVGGNEGKQLEEADTVEKALKRSSSLDGENGVQLQGSVPNENAVSCPESQSAESRFSLALLSSVSHQRPSLTSREEQTVLDGRHVSHGEAQHKPSKELSQPSGAILVVPSNSKALPTSCSPKEEKDLLISTSLDSSHSQAQVISGKRHREFLLARKARKEKFFSRVTFSNLDPKYYSNLPVQPAMGWWKSVLSSRSHSPLFASRLARSLNVPIPDTVYSSSTDSFYVSTRPDALQGTSDIDSHSSINASVRYEWFIQSEFSSAKILEGNLASCISRERRRQSTFTSGISTSPTSATGISPRNQNRRRTSMNRGGSLAFIRSQVEAAGRASRAWPPPCTNSPSSVSGSNSLFKPADAYPAAVVKQMHYLRKDCNITKALDLTTFSTISSDTSVERLYQAFVRGRPRSRCQLTRVCWHASRSPSGFTLLNKLTPAEARKQGGDLTSQYCVSCDNPTLNGVSRTYEEEERRNADPSETSFDVIPVAGTGLEKAAEIARDIFHFTQNLFKIWLDMLVVDLVRSAEDGVWYFLQVKSFMLRQASLPVTLGNYISGKRETLEDGEEEWTHEKGNARVQGLARYSIPTVCHMCGLKRSKHELGKVVNQRMMLETQHHMRKRGIDILFFSPAGRLQLSSNCPVCSICYSLYLAEKELIEVELELGRTLRQPMAKNSEAFFSFTGVMDAIQCTLQPNDPYLVDMLRVFSNAPPRQLSFDRMEPADNPDGRIDLRICPTRERESILSFGNVSDERSRGTVDSVTGRLTCTPQANGILRAGDAATGGSANNTLFSSEAAASSCSTKTPLAALQSSSSSEACSGYTPDAGAVANTATASAGGATGLQTMRSPFVSPSSLPTTRGCIKAARSIPIGSTVFAPPKQTMRGGEAVALANSSRDQHWRQIPTKLYQWRMMLFLHSLQDLPQELLQRENTGHEQQADDSVSVGVSDLVIELKIFGESRTVSLHPPQSSDSVLRARRARFAASTLPDSALAASGGKAVCRESSQFAATVAADPPSCNSSRTEQSTPRPNRAADLRARRRSVESRSAQYLPIKRILVFYLFSAKPSLQQIFHRENLQIRLLASSRAAASAEAECSCWCGYASSPPPCSMSPHPAPPTHHFPSSPSVTPHALSDIHTLSSSPSCSAPAPKVDEQNSSCPPFVAAGGLDAASGLKETASGEVRGDGGQCCECGRWRRPPCPLLAAATGQGTESAAETGRTSCYQVSSGKRPTTVSSAAVEESQHPSRTGTVYSGAGGRVPRSNRRPASASTTLVGFNRNGSGHRRGSRHSRPGSNSVVRCSSYGDLFEVAAGSCSLQRLAGVKRSKQQTYVLLFSKTCWAQPRLRLVLGLHQDMQIPSQYACVQPYADAYLPTRPYTSPCPLPSEWLDCYSAPSTGSASSSSSGSTAGGLAAVIAAGARPVTACEPHAETHPSDRLISSARRAL